MPAPLISAVIPAYRSATVIREALASACGQTVRDIEIVVVDDASPDETAEVVGAEARRDPRIRLVRLDVNGGPAVARNRGVEQATGEWVAFLDADDVWLPDRLAAHLGAVADRPEAILTCGRRVALGGEAAHLHAVAGATATRPLTLDELAEYNPVATSTVTVRRSAFLATGGFDARFRGPEDYDLWLRLVAVGPALFIERPVALYRQRQGSLSMDDRAFLPHVLAVVDKAFRPGGVLHGRSGERRAKAYLHLSACWMAMERGAPVRALRLFARSLIWWPWGLSGQYAQLPWARAKLLAYLIRRRGAAPGVSPTVASTENR